MDEENKKRTEIAIQNILSESKEFRAYQAAKKSKDQTELEQLKSFNEQEHLENLVKMKPGSVSAWLSLINFYYIKKLTKKTTTALTKAIANNPNSIKLYVKTFTLLSEFRPEERKAFLYSIKTTLPLQTSLWVTYTALFVSEFASEEIYLEWLSRNPRVDAFFFVAKKLPKPKVFDIFAEKTWEAFVQGLLVSVEDYANAAAGFEKGVLVGFPFDKEKQMRHFLVAFSVLGCKSLFFSGCWDIFFSPRNLSYSSEILKKYLPRLLKLYFHVLRLFRGTISKKSSEMLLKFEDVEITLYEKKDSIYIKEKIEDVFLYLENNILNEKTFLDSVDEVKIRINNFAKIWSDENENISSILEDNFNDMYTLFEKNT